MRTTLSNYPHTYIVKLEPEPFSFAKLNLKPKTKKPNRCQVIQTEPRAKAHGTEAVAAQRIDVEAARLALQDLQDSKS